jgi:predicted Zn-dependent peptidase
MVAVFTGNFDWGQVRDVIEQGCCGWEPKEAGRQLSDTRGSRAKERLEKPHLSREHICLMSPAISASDPRRFAASLLSMIIGDDVGSRFFWELVDKAIAEVASMEFSPMDETGAYFTYIRCSKDNVARSMEIVGRIFAEAAKTGVMEDELTKAKNKVLSALVIKNELPIGRLVDLGFNWTYLRQYRTIEQDVSSIKTVTVADINALIKEYPLSEYAQFSLSPAQNG